MPNGIRYKRPFSDPGFERKSRGLLRSNSDLRSNTQTLRLSSHSSSGAWRPG